MPPVRTLFVPRFGSQLGSSQRDEPEPEPEPDQNMNQTEPPSQSRRGRRGIKRGGVKTGSLLKVKLPKFNNGTLFQRGGTEEDKTPRNRMSEPAKKTKKTVNPGGETQCAGPDSRSVGVDVFNFSQRSTSKATNEKEKVKLAVLRTISRMLEENQLIRQRLATIGQAN